MEKKYNLRSPSVKRLMKEAKELHEPTELYYAQPLEDNLFEWHFTIRGPPDSDFAGGRYHGRITLPPEYPMKPPSIMISTPNGRFEIGKKICLSMSAHHPETWQPSWSIRTVLMALIGFMPTQGAGAIGSLDYTPQERKSLAKKSRDWECPACGISASSALKDGTDDSASAKEAEREAAELASQIVFKGESEKEKKENENISSEASDLPSGANSTEITLNSQSENANSVPATLGIASSGVTDQIPQVPQGYQAWPYSFYPYGHPMYLPPGFGPQDNVVQATGFNPGAQTITCYPSTQTQSTMSTVSSNINDATNIESTVRQRLTHQLQDQAVSPQIRNQDSNLGVQPQAFAPPHTSQRGMASLLIIWILLAAITALVIRRIFILS